MESYNTIRRGDVFFAELTGGVGSEQNGVRPVLVLQNDVGNRHSPTIIVAPLTSKGNKSMLPTHVKIHGATRLPRNSTVLLEQIRTIDRRRLCGFATRLCESGTNIKVIQDVLGHADVSTTMNIYVDVTNELKKNELKSFSAYMEGA